MMKRKIFAAALLMTVFALTGCTVTEADKHDVGMDVVKQTIRSGIHIGTSAALKSIR